MRETDDGNSETAPACLPHPLCLSGPSLSCPQPSSPAQEMKSKKATQALDSHRSIVRRDPAGGNAYQPITYCDNSRSAWQPCPCEAMAGRAQLGFRSLRAL
jgi:hypothetical protein